MSVTAETEVSWRECFRNAAGSTTCSTTAVFWCKKIVSYQVVEFSKSEASGRSDAQDAETDDAGGPTLFFFSLLTLFSSLYPSPSVFSAPEL